MEMYGWSFMLFCILSTVGLLLAAKNRKKLKIGIGVYCAIQITMAYYAFVSRNFPFLNPLVYFYFQTIWFINLSFLIWFQKLR
jgi:hypothetical protein